MDDQTLVQRAVPADWQVEPYGTPGLWVLSPGKFQGFVTIDLKRRAFALGICRPRTPDATTFSGRNWKVALVNAAVAAHQAATA